MDRKAEFLKIWTERVQRDYADALLAWLERETDFFEAPASTRHHGAHPGGLLEHSLNVYHRLRAIVCVETYGATTSDLLAEDVEETVAVLALLHDVCKVNCYHTETRRRKNPETGKVLVLSPNTLKEEYWSPENQLWLAQSGFGCSPTARGRSILCVCLGDGEQTRWNRNDFIGVLKDEYLPDWAKESLKQYQRSENEETQEMQMGGM